jgi:hypothetical protein
MLLSSSKTLKIPKMAKTKRLNRSTTILLWIQTFVLLVLFWMCLSFFSLLIQIDYQLTWEDGIKLLKPLLCVVQLLFKGDVITFKSSFSQCCHFLYQSATYHQGELTSEYRHSAKHGVYEKIEFTKWTIWICKSTDNQ